MERPDGSEEEMNEKREQEYRNERKKQRAAAEDEAVQDVVRMAVKVQGALKAAGVKATEDSLGFFVLSVAITADRGR